eukprot:g52177.t1
MNQQEAQETGDTPSAPIMTPPTSTPRLLNGYWKTLPNWGQTCFANSVIQYITPLVIWMQRSFPTCSWREQPITQLIQRMAVAPDLPTHTDTKTILRLAQVLAIICEEKPGMMTGAIYKQCKPHVPQMRTPTKSTPSSQPGAFQRHNRQRIQRGSPCRVLRNAYHLDLSAYFSPIYTINREAIYTPISFLLHKGPTVNDGHWMAVIRDPHHGWRLHDDSRCLILDHWRDQDLTAVFKRVILPDDPPNSALQTVVPTELLHLNIYETITAVLYQRVDLGAEAPTGHSTQPLPSHSPFFLPTIPRHSHIPEAPRAYPQWMRGPPITLRAPDVPDVVMTLQASRKRKPTETGSPDRSTPAFWEKLCRGILRDMEKTTIGQATVKFMTRSHLLAQAPDSNGILGYDFGGKSLRPVLVPSLTQEVWDLLRYKTWVPITGTMITVENNNPQEETVLGFHRDDERFMSHDEVINLSFGPTAELRIMPYGQQARPKLDGQALILKNGTFHTFNRFQLHKVSMPPNRPNDPTRRISISFRVFTTWAEIPPPLRPRIAQGNTNLQQTLAAWKAKNQADEPQSDSTGDHRPNSGIHWRGIHSTMIFQEIVQSTRFKQSDRHHFCVLLYRPEVPIHADLSTSMICPPDSKWAAPTAILFNQAKIRQQVLTTTNDGMFWGPSTRSAAQQAANPRLFHRTQAREECPGTYPRYHIASIKTARQGWFLLIDPQWTNGFLDHVSAMERKILGGSIDQVVPENRRVVVQRRTPDRPPIGFDYRGDFQWLNQGLPTTPNTAQKIHQMTTPHIGLLFTQERGRCGVAGLGKYLTPQYKEAAWQTTPSSSKPSTRSGNDQGNDPSPPEIPEATASLKEPTTSQNQNLPQPAILPAKGIEAPATPPSTHPSLPTGSLRKTTSPPQPSAPHIFEGVTRKSRSKSPPTARADSDDEIDLKHLINDEAEGWRLEQEEKRQQSRNTPPPPTAPTPDKCKEQQTRASVDTPPGMSNQAPPLPISTTSQVDQGNGGGSSPPTRPGTQITPTHQTQNTSSPLGDQGDERPPHPDATSSAGAPRDKQPPIRLTLTRTQRDTGETKMSHKDSKNPLGSGTSHPPPQHAPPPGRTYNPIPEIGSKITQILKLRADFGEHRQCLLTNHILSPPGPQDISRQITRFLRQRSYYKHVLTPLLLKSPRRQWTLLILSKTLKRELVATTFGTHLPIQQEVKDWISALGTAEVIHKKVELGVVAGPLNHTAGTEEDTIELHVKTFLSSPSGPARGILPITGMPGETGKISPSARTEPQDALNNATASTESCRHADFIHHEDREGGSKPLRTATEKEAGDH